MKNIVLTGYMASGKTTTGLILAKNLNMNFVDTDEMISKRENITISDIFKTKGEKYFRQLENEISLECMKLTDTVIATGGGFVLNRENVDNLRANGIIVNLKVSNEIIKERYINARLSRPLMDKEDFENIIKRYNDRKEFYKNCDIEIAINVGDSPDYICEKIIYEYNKIEVRD